MFSVLIPVYNHEKYVVEAVLSAARCALVSEVLLVDDGSKDRSPDIVSSLSRSNPKLIRDLTVPGEGNLGAHTRLNQLVEAAKNEWVAVLNSDDAFVPGRFETIAAYLKRGTRADFICGYLLIMNADGVVVGTKRGLLQPEYPHPFSESLDATLVSRQMADFLGNQNFIATTSNMILKRSLHRRVNGFRPFRYVHDWAFALHAGAVGHPLYLPHFLTRYRIHGRNTIKEDKKVVVKEVRMLFRQFVTEHEDYERRPIFRKAIEGNKYLSDDAWT